MDSHSLSQHMRHIESRTHDKIDKLRYKVSQKVMGNLEAKTEFLRKEMKSLLRRTDVVGYGPSKPRVAVVVVVPSVSESYMEDYHPGQHVDHSYEDKLVLNGALEAVESIFRTTDRNRIFVVTVIMDGRGKVGEFEASLNNIDSGRTAHRHGNQVHTHKKEDEEKKKKKDEKEKHSNNEEEAEETHAHSEKIHAIYNHESIGVAASRREGVQLINILAHEHEAAGLKSPEEDLILLFLRCDARLLESEHSTQETSHRRDRTWLDDVTDALILSPIEEGYDNMENDAARLLLENGNRVPNQNANNKNAKGGRYPRQLQPANAVSFNIYFSSTDSEGNIELHPPRHGDTTTFNRFLQPVPSRATAQQMSLSDGETYPAPLTTVATAMRLETYNDLPSNDDMLTTHHAADLELSFNLWMCADGADILGSAATRVAVDPRILRPSEKAKLSGPLAARIVSAWMSAHEDDGLSNLILTSIAEQWATVWSHKVDRANPNRPKDHTLADRREVEDKMQELKHALVRIASEAKQSDSFPSGLAKKCRPFSWYVQNIHPRLDDDGLDPSAESGGKGSSIGLPSPEKDVEKLIPIKPLGEENMGIVAKASPVKLAYVDASGGHVQHPHRGATDENGNYGYVHDETALRKNPPEFKFADKNERSGLCKKGDPNWKMLTEKVFVDLTNHEAAERRAEHGLSRKKRAKIFCLVYTIEKYHDRIPAIRETWGQKCDGFMVASTKTDKSLGTVNIPHEGPEEYNNIWQKVRSMWSYIYDNYYEKYDYFHIGGDDLYLIVENLRLYLESEEIQLASNGGHTLPDGSEDMQTPLFMGRRFAEGGNRDRMFLSGGSGYTMNKAALKTLVVDGFPQCFPHLKTFSEDVMVATCFRKMEILPFDTKDEAGGERYMPFQPGHHLTYTPPANPKDDWYSNYSVDVKWGIDHCAAKSVAFHYIKADLMRRMHAILYHFC